ncbi:TPA: hypothetical protein HA259_03935 [Thermoplasmata archaeon]|nr:hypothetical protein [Thermoplasmata archaeon]
MRAGEAWGAITILFMSGVALVSAFLIAEGEELYFVLPFGVVAVAIYLYVLYKRYRVELVTEGDVRLFDDPEDLRVLCAIYGLPRTGNPNWLRHRLVRFAKDNSDNNFVWVAPKALKKLASGFEVATEKEEEEEIPDRLHDFVMRMVSDKPEADWTPRPLLWGVKRSRSRLSSIEECPICEAEVEGGGAVCEECGADLEFYQVLSESKVGRRIVAQRAVRRLRET